MHFHGLYIIYLSEYFSLCCYQADLLVLEASNGSAGVVQAGGGGEGKHGVEWVHQHLGARSFQPQLLVGVLVVLLQLNNSLWVHFRVVCWSIR